MKKKMVMKEEKRKEVINEGKKDRKKRSGKSK